MRRTFAAALLAGLAAASGTTLATEAAPPRAHFHHVHLNVTDPQATRTFYEKFFGANEVRYRDRSDALFTEKSFILLTKVAHPAPSNLGTSLWHIGWAGVDGPSEFAWRVREGIGVQTPVTPFGGEYYMYFWGPDRELVEVWTGSRNHRFEHVHLLASNLSATVSWFENNLGLRRQLSTDQKVSGVATQYIWADNVKLSIMERPASGQPRPAWWPAEVGETMPPTDGTVIDHIAFSFSRIEPVLERMRRAGVTVVHPIATSAEYGLTSFFVRGPDGLLVEIVAEAPIPEGIWQGQQ